MRRGFYFFTYVIISLILLSLNIFGKEFHLSEFKKHSSELLNLNNAGQEFWLTFNPCRETPGGENKLKLYITSSVETTVTVEIQGKNYISQKTTIPTDIIEFDLTPEQGQCYQKTDSMPPETDGVYLGYGVHVYANDPIICYAVTNYQNSGEGYLAIPVSALGKNYIVSSWADNSDNSTQYFPSYTAIVAPFDNTIVRFTLGGTQGTKTAGGLFDDSTVKFALYKGDILLIASSGKGSDLSGSKIIASKPVSVLSSNYRAYVPENVGNCNFICEMETPTSEWGKTYLYTPIYTRKKNSYLKIFAKEPSTNIYRNGLKIASLVTGGGMLDSGWVKMRADESSPSPIIFTGDKPINVVQYNCGLYDDSVASNPFMMSITALEQYQNEITFNTPGIKGGNGFTYNYINIVYRTDNDSIPNDLEFATVYGGKYVWKKMIDIDPRPGLPFNILVGGHKYFSKTLLLPSDGVYKIRANAPLAAYSYGFSNFDAYGFPSSAAFRDLEKNDTLPPDPTWVEECDGSIDNALVEDMPRNPDRSELSMIVLNSDSSYNYRFSYDNFIPGEDAYTHWSARVNDLKKDARLVVTFFDMAGNDTTITVDYSPYFLNIKPDIDFGNLKIGDTVIKETFANNETSNHIFCDSITLKNNNQGFELINVLPFILASGSSIKIQVKFTATKTGEFIDSLCAHTCLDLNNYSCRVHAIVDSVTSVKEELIKPIDIFPNPADNYLSINLQGITQKTNYVRIFDSYGNVVYLNINVEGDNLKISTSAMPSGMYFLQIRSGGGMFSRKVVVVH